MALFESRALRVGERYLSHPNFACLGMSMNSCNKPLTGRYLDLNVFISVHCPTE